MDVLTHNDLNLGISNLEKNNELLTSLDMMLKTENTVKDQHINILQEMFDNYLSLESNNNNLIKLFPNPTDGLVRLSSEDNYKIDVFDNIGKLVFTTIGNSFNIQSLEKGSYFIKLASDNSTISTYKILRK